MDNNKKYIIFFLLAVLIFIASGNVGIFWDNVLFVSKIGGHFYENGLLSLPLPENIDPAKPPFYSMLHTVLWQLLGKDLWVSHLVQLPFVFLLFVQLYRFVSYFINSEKHRILTFVLILAEPTLDAQLILVSPEIVQVSLFFLALNSVLYKRKRMQFTAIVFLSLVSYRSMMLAAGVFVFDMLYNCLINKYSCKKWLIDKKSILLYLLAALPSVSYLVWRYIYTGWIYTSPNSPWLEFYGTVSATGFLRNILVIGHRFADFGRIILFAIAFWLIIKHRVKDKNLQTLIVAFVSSSLVVGVVSIISKNPMGHRYFLSSFIILVITVSYLIGNYGKKKAFLGILAMAGLLLGNLIVYPRHIAQGWDASLAFYPYFGLRESAIEYMDKSGIKIEETATFFPNQTKISNISFNDDNREFIEFSGKEKYVLYTNVSNLSDDELEILNTEYFLIKRFEHRNVEFCLYKNNKDFKDN